MKIYSGSHTFVAMDHLFTEQIQVRNGFGALVYHNNRLFLINKNKYFHIKNENNNLAHFIKG